MSEQQLWNALIGFVVGTVGTYVGLYWKIREKLVAQYDRDLRSDRLKCYLDLWRLTEALAFYSPPRPVTAFVVRDLSVQLREWYFRVGGIFFSEPARDAYFALQKALTRPTNTVAEHDELNQEQVVTLRALASELRTALTADVGSRLRPLLSHDEGP